VLISIVKKEWTLTLLHVQAHSSFLLTLIFVVTTSPYWHRVIFAPAAFLGSGRQFSSALSGIEPLFPVTRDKLFVSLDLTNYLIGQSFFWFIAMVSLLSILIWLHWIFPFYCDSLFIFPSWEVNLMCEKTFFLSFFILFCLFFSFISIFVWIVVFWFLFFCFLWNKFGF